MNSRERGKHSYYKTQQFSLGFSLDVLHCLAEVKSKGLVNAFPIFTKAKDHNDEPLKTKRWPEIHERDPDIYCYVLVYLGFPLLIFSVYYSPEKQIS